MIKWDDSAKEDGRKFGICWCKALAEVIFVNTSSINLLSFVLSFPCIYPYHTGTANDDMGGFGGESIFLQFIKHYIFSLLLSFVPH